MIKKKELVDEIAHLTDEIAALRKIQKEHEELESFITWLNELCMRKQYQFCGIRKITFKRSPHRPCYIGFVLKSKLYLEPEKHYQYTIYGYLSTAQNKAEPPKAYTANLTQRLSERPIGITNTMELSDNFVDPYEIQHEGIGSAGMQIIKELAKLHHCSHIVGSKHPRTNTPEGLDELTAFYHAHGFDQDDQSRKISFDMRNYQPSSFEVRNINK